MDQIVAGFDKIPGPLTFYRGRNEQKDAIYLEIGESVLDRWFVVNTTASTGTQGTPARVYPGQPLRDRVFRMTVLDNGAIGFFEPNLTFRAPGAPEIEAIIRRSFPQTLFFVGKVVARQEDRKTVLVDASGWLRSDFAEIAASLKSPVGEYVVDSSGSFVRQIEGLPENSLLNVVYKLDWRGAGEAPKSVLFAVNHNFFRVPETNYRPRFADTRVGYFTTDFFEDQNLAFFDYSDPGSNDKVRNFLIRWDLRKRNPGSALSEPEEPIVWWLDDSIPDKYRESVREGILMWNKAFEAIGFRNAIVVKDRLPNASWDIADVRYNVFRWTVDIPFAIALTRVNPFTGQILSASVNFDASFADEFLTHKFLGLATSTTEGGQSPTQALGLCAGAMESRSNLSTALAACHLVAGDDKNLRERIVQQYIRQIAAHEVGHCLGLRHNFVASTHLTPEQLGDAEVVAREGTSASVMDYSSFNIFALRKPQVDWYSRTVGKYDRWAIAYGYGDQFGQTPDAELSALRLFAASGSAKGLQFETDDVANLYDPYVSLFDLGGDPLAFRERMLRTTRHLMFDLGSKKPRNGESYFEFTRFFLSLLTTYVDNGDALARFIGGSRLNNSYFQKQKSSPPISELSAREQKQALTLLQRYFFSESALDFPKEYFSMLTGNPNARSTQTDINARVRPVFKMLSDTQKGILRSLFEPTRLSRVVNNEFRSKDPASAFRLSDLYDSVRKDVWKELASPRQLSPLRRQLQREHLGILLNLMTNRPPAGPDDAFTLAKANLGIIHKEIKARNVSGDSEVNREHYAECLTRIEQALNAQVVASERLR